MNFYAIPTSHVRAFWPLVELHLARACARGLGDESPETLRDECVAGDAQLLAILDGDRSIAAAVSRFVPQPEGGLVCCLVAAGGRRLAEWRRVIPEFEAWARHHGASSVRLTGRPGWTQVFTGYRRVPLVTLVKEL